MLGELPGAFRAAAFQVGSSATYLHGRAVVILVRFEREGIAVKRPGKGLLIGVDLE